MNPQADKIVRRITMVATVTASYFLLTADYGPEPNVLDPVKNSILSAQNSLKEEFWIVCALCTYKLLKMTPWTCLYDDVSFAWLGYSGMLQGED
ncbi:hypothetical protein V6N13_022053 [Hibiscus sabdariffa]